MLSVSRVFGPSARVCVPRVRLFSSSSSSSSAGSQTDVAATAAAAPAADPASTLASSAANPAPVQLTAEQQYQLRLQYHTEQERRASSMLERMRSSSGTIAGAFIGSDGSRGALTRRPGARSKDAMSRVHAAMDYKNRVQREKDARKQDDAAAIAAAEAEAAAAAASMSVGAQMQERATDASGKAKSWFKKFF